MSIDDYEALDLTAFCNAGAAVHTRPAPATGPQTYHGLPFLIGSGDHCYIAFRGDSRPMVRVPLERTAHRIIFAQVLLNSMLWDGDPIGRTVARYTFVYGDGQRVVVPIRERFEIGVLPVRWGEQPFLTTPDRHHQMRDDRYGGNWQAAARRQEEVEQGIPQDFYLWVWANPRRAAVLEAIEIEAVGEGAEARDFLIAAVTLCHTEEEPFVRHAAVPVLLTLPQAEDAAAPFDLKVTIDRGLATYPWALPAQSASDFLADSLPGWGEPLNEASSPAYVEITGTPSATVCVTASGEELGRANWGELEAAGRIETPRVHFEVVNSGQNWVHTTVLDDATGKPIPCRLHFRSPHGIPYQPHGHHAHVNGNLGTFKGDFDGDVRLGQISYAYIDGTCQGWLPRGEVIVDVGRGFEYEPLRAKVDIAPGQRELTLRLKRSADMNAARYFSGDPHVHFLHSQAALLEGAGEDLDVVNILLTQFGNLFANAADFVGRPVYSADGGTVVHASQENRQHLLGHLTLLGLTEMVMPWCSDGPREAELAGNLETTLSHWADACHAQGGTVIIPHMPNPNGEPAALIATGRADAVEMCAFDHFNHVEYYRYLNGGYRMPLVGGTDKMDAGVPVGIIRTYAHIPNDQAFSFEAWCAGLRGGNTFLSSGPLLSFTVDGRPIGSTVHLRGTGGTVTVEARATSIFPIHTLQIVQNGHVVAQTDEAQGARALNLKTELRIEGDSWLCARAAGPGYTAHQHHDSWRRGIMAHTSPIYLACGDVYNRFDPATAHYMLHLLDGSLQYMRHHALQWRPGTTTHHHGEHDHQAFLERPFHEAIAAVHRRLHEHGIPH